MLHFKEFSGNLVNDRTVKMTLIIIIDASHLYKLSAMMTQKYLGF